MMCTIYLVDWECGIFPNVFTMRIPICHNFNSCLHSVRSTSMVQKAEKRNRILHKRLWLLIWNETKKSKHLINHRFNSNDIYFGIAQFEHPIFSLRKICVHVWVSIEFRTGSERSSKKNTLSKWKIKDYVKTTTLSDSHFVSMYFEVWISVRLDDSSTW